MQKKLLLVASILFGTVAYSQDTEFTASNTFTLGDSLSMYVVDSAAVSYAAITGEDVIWDYSTLTGYEGPARMMKVLDPSNTPNASKFADAAKALDIPGVLTLYTSDDETGQNSHGVVFQDPKYGELVGAFNTIPSYEFPFGYSSPAFYNGNVTGTLSFDFNGTPINNATMAGSLTSIVDGVGTLKLTNNDYNNVVRYKVVDTLNATVSGLDVKMISTQYAYYSFELSNLPIFMYTNISYGLVGAAQPISEYTVVLSYENPAVEIEGPHFTSSNTPIIGDNLTLYVVDSAAVNYEAVIGSGVEWDYSQLNGYDSESRIAEVVNPANTPNAAKFTQSEKALVYEDILTMYITEDANGRKTQGVVFNDPTFDEVVGTFDNAHVYNYPFGYGSPIYSNNVAGTVSFELNGNQITDAPTEAVLHSEIDGIGTLKLALNDYENVIRYKLVDTIEVNLMGNEVLMIGTQFTYFDLETSNLPIFIHANFIYKIKGNSNNISNYSVVLSYENPAEVGLSTVEMDQTKVYPNPTQNTLNIQLPSTITSANVTITDASGRNVYNAELTGNTQSIDVSSLNQGLYFVQINNGEISTTKKVIIK